METKVVGGWDTRWKVLEGAWVVGTCGLEFRCCMECNTITGNSVLEPLRRLWCKVTLQSRLMLGLQTIDSQARIGKNRGSRLSKSEGLEHLLVQAFCKKKGMH